MHIKELVMSLPHNEYQFICFLFFLFCLQIIDKLQLSAQECNAYNLKPHLIYAI